ncbi:diptericin-A-like [Rhagoletis pomonella]|uniref:diptericin-A-like n=1 Tax=Rhagoletis pomonella TaxID=28610 RepID=UPI0017876372|nr:diptericin-A-like [Rhagoletis pomonella]XP_036344879.1 diptericin-A-like [Rhagoletis pomonella]XP_036344958.1 diptericin-A-like [Rhagoletis pomonella]XP_036344991.1 diptericin-A-like [Rhagoletis pomonella]
MFTNVFISICILTVALAYPQQQQPPRDKWQSSPDSQRFSPQLNIQGGGSPHKGIDLNVDTRVPVWQSNNGRHSFDATGQYSQHLGGPYGNSRPNWGAGGVYTYRF